MAKTLLTRIKNIEQYDIANKTVLWEDLTESRWTHDYGKLEPGDNIIFIGAEKLKGKLLIGDVSQINFGLSILCTKVQEVFCTNDQLLQLHEIYPELISRVKANFQPFIHSQIINITKLIDDANQKRFVSFYILSGIDKYNKISSSLNINDRVVLINDNHQFENIKIHSITGLINFPSVLNIRISTEGQTLKEVLEKNKSIKRKSAKSNNVTRVNDIIKAITERDVFKFTSFFTYYDTLYNKLVYHSGVTPVLHLSSINLESNETVFKVSMSGKAGEINEDAYNYFIKENLIVVHGKTKAKGTSTITQGNTFYELMKIGDYFYLCRGNDFLEIIGKITGDAVRCEYDNFGDEGWLQRSYEVVREAVNDNSYEDEQKWWTPNDNSTCIAIPQNEINVANEKLFVPFFNAKFEYKQNQPTTNKTSGSMKIALNQILYGPPGTGKTYNTINKAIAIANPNFDLTKPRKEIKQEFERLMKEGQVVFTTFHQSMSYEDFIEGIKPLKPNQGDTHLKYDVLPGIFKKVCQDAKTPNLVGFDAAYENLKTELTATELLSLKTPTGKEFSVSLNSNDNLTLHTGQDKEKQGTLTKENIQKQINGEEKFKGWEGYFKGVINYLKIKYKYSENESVVGKNYVLIIDEINRGNVSQIFGELITLIEEDKRLGKDEVLEVTLPYSKDKFSVPSNLYIIGTMNTADRSVEAIDTALRRRFSFEEMPPKYDLNELQYEFAGVKGFEILQTLNKRIEKLLDKDHQLGHSYFMMKDGDNVEEKLINSLYKNIVPLLQEYFFGDFGKIGLVLGKGFVKMKTWDKNADSFADFDYQSSSEFDGREVFGIMDYRKPNTDYTIKIKDKEVPMDIQKAIKLLMKMDIE